MNLATLEGTPHRECGGHYELHTENVTVRVSGMTVDVVQELFRCANCGHERRTIDQRDELERRAIERIRLEHGLLAPRAIRRLRELLGLTVPQFAELIHGTPKGIVEGWEKGRYLQNREADALIRSLADREILERRAARVGITLPGTDVGGDQQAISDSVSANIGEPTQSSPDCAF